MKKYVIVFLLVSVGLAFYVVFQNTSNPSDTVYKNFGTFSTSLGSPPLGLSDASITLIEFGNYQCSKCQRWFQETMPLLVTNYVNQGKINFIFVDADPKTKNALLASIASYCANEHKKYWEYHNLLFLHSKENETDTKLLKQLASEIELDLDSFEKCLQSAKYTKKIKYASYEAKKNGINRIPTFIILDSEGNYEKLSGLQSYQVFKEKIDLMLP